MNQLSLVFKIDFTQIFHTSLLDQHEVTRLYTLETTR